MANGNGGYAGVAIAIIATGIAIASFINDGDASLGEGIGAVAKASIDRDAALSSTIGNLGTRVAENTVSVTNIGRRVDRDEAAAEQLRLRVRALENNQRAVTTTQQRTRQDIQGLTDVVKEFDDKLDRVLNALED